MERRGPWLVARDPWSVGARPRLARGRGMAPPLQGRGDLRPELPGLRGLGRLRGGHGVARGGHGVAGAFLGGVGSGDRGPWRVARDWELVSGNTSAALSAGW